MKNFFKIVFFYISLVLVFLSKNGFSQSIDSATSQLKKTAVEERIIRENNLPPNYFSLGVYRPNYVLPYYVTFSPDNAIYQNNTPHNESLKKSEFKYQLSLQVPVWKTIFHSRSSLFLAYTQVSYWQVYNRSKFFRETDYEPEVFWQMPLSWGLTKDWKLTLINIGATHQSNGFGNELERSWNRAYVEAVASSENCMISLKPWYVLSTYPNNRDIAQYLGYGRIIVAYKFHKQVISLEAHNIFEKRGRHKTAAFTYSFPLTPYIKGYVQAFSGYGQSLIEYNHRTNSVGIGVAFNDWV
ncbi:MAG: phospholipase [Gammaproteobacteria bacterium]|jgi:phospholipase A1|nr:phospholipase [Gammaproteobacteria bacterium]